MDFNKINMLLPVNQTNNAFFATRLSTNTEHPHKLAPNYRSWYSVTKTFRSHDYITDKVTQSLRLVQIPLVIILVTES